VQPGRLTPPTKPLNWGFFMSAGNESLHHDGYGVHSVHQLIIRVESMKIPCMKAPCKDCPFRTDTLKGWLGAERMAGILNDDSFTCHKKTDMQCAGHMLIKGEENAFVGYAARLGIRLNLSGQELVFDNQSACIAHHE